MHLHGEVDELKEGNDITMNSNISNILMEILELVLHRYVIVRNVIG